MTTIALGNTGRLHITFTPVSGNVALADVLITVTSPSLATQVLTPVANGANRFYADVVVSDFAELGDWTVRWDSNPPSELITVFDTYTVVALGTTVSRERSNVAVTIQRIRRQLDSSVRQEYNRLGASALIGDDVITMDFDIQPALRAGALLSIESELLKVVSVNTSSKEVTVIRGFQDTLAAAHADALEVLVSPRWTLHDIKDTMVAEIESWAPRLFRVINYQWAVSEDDETVELPIELSDALGVIGLRRQWTDDSDSNSWPEMAYRTMRGTVGIWGGATVSGLLIRMLPNLGVARSGAVAALIAVPFDVSTYPLLDSEDFVGDYGLSPSMLEVVELGVKMRLLGDAEIGRSARSQQDEPRKAEEVQSGSAMQAAQTIRTNYLRRFGDEQRKLQTAYPLSSW